MPELSIAALRQNIPHCSLRDRFPIQRKLMQLQRQKLAADKLEKALQGLQTRIDSSMAAVARRRENVPVISYPEGLPVSERLEDIRAAIDSHQVVILAGETGSGKTTQLPKICLEMGRGITGMIAHTQPRRLAARTVANRIAEELNTPLGEGVAFQIRFQEVASPNSYIKLMTDGILLAAIQRDRFLNDYDTIIIDEAHERSLNIDFLLGYLKTLLPKRPDLKLIITSATIDVERFSAHFNQAPVVEVSGRSYPVEYRYRPLEELSAEKSVGEGVAAVLNELVAEGAQKTGDTLVFFSGEREIREAANVLRKCDFPGAEVLPLYARLSNAEQQRIFDTRGRRGWRIVLATNVAETSLTVPGIRYVIDTGTARVSRYSVKTKVQRLPIEPVSQASANQRAGRCGRVAPGIAYRLYGEEDYLARPLFTEPEIQRTNLAAVILQMLQLRLGDIENFPFVDPPDKRYVNDGYALLAELAAVDNNVMTPLGKQLGQFPVDPRIGRLLLAAAELGCLKEMLIIASALSIQDPRDRPSDKQQAADQQHRRFKQDDSDFSAFIALWDYAEEQRQALSSSQWRKLCQREFLSWVRMREWREVHHQLLLMTRRMKLPINSEAASYEQIHRALLPGFLGQIGCKGDEGEFLGARNRKLRIFPGSSLAKKPPAWIVAAELAETSQLFARCVAKINPEWVIGVNDALLKRHYHEPRYQPRSGRVMAREQTTLYGLTVRDNVSVHYGVIDAVVAREIFIREALVARRYRGRAAFFKHNTELIDEVLGLEDKTRRRDVLVSDEDMYRFYDERLPSHIVTVKHLDSFLKKAANADVLNMARGDVMRQSADVSEVQFPSSIKLAGQLYGLRYHFEPGHDADGVSVLLPLSSLASINSDAFDWLVPGLLREKCIALVKALPKSQRKQLVPVPDFVDRALPLMSSRDISLLPELARALRRLSGVDIDLQQWQQADIDTYYKMRFCILDDAEKELVSGRDMTALRKKLADKIQRGIAEETTGNFVNKTVCAWDFGELEAHYQFKRGPATFTAYPTLRDSGDAVDVCLLETEREAQRTSQQGVLRLLLLRMPQESKTLRGKLFRGNTMQLQFAAVGETKKQWLEGCLLAAAKQCFKLDASALPRSSSEFDTLFNAGSGNFVDTANALAGTLEDVLATYAEIRRLIKKLNSLSFLHSVTDINQQLAALFQMGFIVETPWALLQEYHRYLRAILRRIEKMNGNLQRERQCTLLLEPLQQQFEKALKKAPYRLLEDAQFAEYRCAIEEFRVSLFAQELGTKMPVSEKRLKAMWKSLSNP